MSKDFAMTMIALRTRLQSVEDCEDGEEMIYIAQEVAADIDTLQESIEDRWDI